MTIIPVQRSFGQTHLEITPSVSVSEEYNDNIDLDASDEKSDYITRVSPGVMLSWLSRDSELSITYMPSFVWYAQETEDETITHSGTVALGHNVTENLRFDLTDTIIRSDEPLEETEDIEGARETREKYWRNSSHAAFMYIFGPGKTSTIGYDHSYLKNDAEDVDDGRIQSPYVEMTYAFNIKHSVDFHYGYTMADFWRDDMPPGGEAAGDDYEGHEAGMTYTYNITPHNAISMTYDLTTRQFKGTEEDYKVHDISVGYDHAFSPELSFVLGAGYFIEDNDYSDDETGISYDVALTKLFERGSFILGGAGGWDEAYLEAERRGFSRYWSVNTGAEYEVFESVTGYAGATYREDKDEDNREWKSFSGNCGLTWEFMRWFSLSLDYAYTERDDDFSSEDYKVNQILLILTAERLFRL